MPGLRQPPPQLDGVAGAYYSPYYTPEADMATRTVRLDREAEEVLAQIRHATGLPISETLKRGLRALQQQLETTAEQTPYDIFRELDLGPGGYAIGPSTESRQLVRRAVAEKLRR